MFINGLPKVIKNKSKPILLANDTSIFITIIAIIIIIQNIAAKAALKFGSEAWVLKKREEQRLEAAQIKFSRQLLGITKLDKEKNQYIRGKKGSTEHSTGNKTVPEKVATTRTEDGHK